MEITTSNLCDKILEVALQGTYLLMGERFSFQQMCKSTGASEAQAETALQVLWKNSYLEKINHTFVLTPQGESFAKTGGFVGQRKRDRKEEEAKEDQRNLTKALRCSAVWTAIATVVMALATIAIALFSYLQWIRPR